MKKLFYLAFAAFAFAACNDDKYTPEISIDPPMCDTYISFEASEHLMDVNTGEDVVLGDLSMKDWGGSTVVYKDVLCGKAYATTAAFDSYLFGTADQTTWFGSYYSNQYDAWGGVALSKTGDKKTATGGMSQQFSVWADGGVFNSQTFAVCYDMNSPTVAYPEYMADFGYPTIDFTEAVRPAFVYIANSTYVYNYFQGAASDSFKVKIQGSLKDVPAGSVTVTLIEGTMKVSDWMLVDLAQLGLVDKITFSVICDITKDPTFFCIDGLGINR